MKHKTILTIQLLLFYSISFSQANFEKGFMISNTGDTISGWIDFRDWNTGPFTIEFKNDLSLPALKLNAQSIRGFTVHDQIYKSLHLNVDVSPHDTYALLKGPERKLKELTIFAQTIVESPDGFNLYYQADENSKMHFFCSREDSVFELRQIRYIDTAKSVALTIDEWLFQLLFLTADCPDAMNETHSEFSISYIAAVIDDYNHCMDFESVNYDERHEKRSLFGICGGLSSGKINYATDTGGDYFGNADYSSGSGFTAGAFYDLDLPHRRETWWFSTSVLIHQFSSSGRSESETSLNTEINEIEFKQTDIKLIPALKMQMNTSPFKAYLKAGPVVSKALQSSNQTTTIITNKFTAEVDSTTIENDIEKNVYHFGALIAGGVNWNGRLFAEAGFERGFFTENYSSVDGFENDLYISLYIVLN